MTKQQHPGSKAAQPPQTTTLEGDRPDERTVVLERELVIAARTRLGYSQAQLANVAGVSEDTISRAENRKPIRKALAGILAAALQVTISDLTKPILSIKPRGNSDRYFIAKNIIDINIAQINIFLYDDLIRSIKAGKKVFEPSKEWSALIKYCIAIREAAFTLSEREAEFLDELIDDLQNNMNAIVGVMRAQAESDNPEKTYDDAIKKLNEKIDFAKIDFYNKVLIYRKTINT